MAGATSQFGLVLAMVGVAAPLASNSRLPRFDQRERASDLEWVVREFLKRE